MKKILLSIILLIAISGCKTLSKTESGGVTGSASTGIISRLVKSLPGYQNKQIKYWEYKLEKATLQKKFEKVELDRLKIEIDYNKLGE